MSDNGATVGPAVTEDVEPRRDEYRGIFDISDADGVNDSERLLMRLWLRRRSAGTANRQR